MGLVASVLLHGIVLDWWRGRAGVEVPYGRASRHPALQARLQSGSSLGMPVERLQTRSYEDTDGKLLSGLDMPSDAVKLPQSGWTGATVASVESVVLVPASVAQETSLRPLSLSEGLVAYRLALLAALQPTHERLPATLRLGLAIPAGKGVSPVLDVKISSGDFVADQAWQAAVLRAATKAELPSVLRGSAFEMVLEFEP